MHTLCEQDFPPLERTWAAVQPLLRPHVPALTWNNFGGGHHIPRADSQTRDLVAFLHRVRAETDCDLMIDPGEEAALAPGRPVGRILAQCAVVVEEGHTHNERTLREESGER